MPGKALSETVKKRRGPSVLLLAALLIAFLYSGVLAWLALTDGRFAGKPVVEIALAPEPLAPNVPPADKLLRTGSDENHPAAASDASVPTDAASDDESADKWSSDEQALLDAARKVHDDDGGAGDGVKIVGAETLSGSDALPASVTALKPVPDPALVAQGRQGPLPIVAKDGRKAWQVYARPLPEGLRAGPHIALVVSGLGISDSATAHAIETLPPEVTLSFAPYGSGLQNWIAKARGRGHEVLLELPMEPFGYPQNDPGPYTLLTSLQTAENISRLEWLMSRFSGYAGVMNYQGARFTASAAALSPVLSTLKSRGLMYVDNGASQRSLAPKLGTDLGLPIAVGTRMVDPVQNPDIIDQSLAALEAAARQSGAAVGIASGFPITVDEVTQWAATLKSKGFVLVPVSAAATAN